ncbi:unnamed protein product [Caenorhabditis angaria]|uniref:Uncharacterized protein n=1 Tax=Caenorhabditis angaria TaxID=860376 RepID=A0A9P1MV01_9PELO|nr:unnamed protein product [Caenorhabditis angaria]
MSNEQPSNESKMKLPDNLFETVLKKCEKKNMENMGYCAVNLNDWLPAKYIKKITLCNSIEENLVQLLIVFIKTPDPLNAVKIEGSFENVENGTQIKWIIKHSNTTSDKQTYLSNKNYIELSLVEFWKYLNLSRDTIQELSQGMIAQEKCEENELYIGERTFLLSEQCFQKLDKAEILNAPVQANGDQYSILRHPIFCDYRLWFIILPFPLRNLRAIMIETKKILN